MVVSKTITDSIKNDLNSTGIFLESYVYDYFKKRGSYGVEREVPYNISVGAGSPIDGEADIVASSRIDSNIIVCFVVECKRALPEQKYWVFEKGHVGPSPHPLLTYVLPANSASYRHDIHLSGLGYMQPSDYESAINMYEFDIKSGKRINNFDKRERAFIALRQINEAFSGLTTSPHLALRVAHNTPPSESLNVLYVPIVVTTGNLLVAEYDAKNIDYLTGNILDTANITLIEKGWVHFEFALSGALRANNGNYSKRPTFVVNIDSLDKFVNEIETSAKSYM